MRALSDRHLPGVELKKLPRFADCRPKADGINIPKDRPPGLIIFFVHSRVTEGTPL
jgi:hypothetical protein